ncbi:potassium-transporting ATPase subunit C [Mycolicibacterium smegmatis]|uniref:potassium-transporting ATPase subunit C n=1 Tax=Mycolicibacterium smegmatis TaxID=1772 RepID=UPI0005D83B2A|nr:potassium-transporting ATPase subunit C [Mycolicibacterium smegmatis]MDF1898280.1 potassium-transporting ATPase subunit C [Mycolicibacterium smegmatis]MDF1906311.1 potassium-transporting ATPase subunit C [Mycolicibacterium smegmatis]MDF1916537.1 potassium-transporting ATPase subunit C [Mycolicibacterium smegmatis]MDF1922621.1 potassium-transporting ATPase subunit C [Mycolicibacterium smegmatis]UAK56914.1 potassium-transporting ATPase subunit C [Mycolicibacterium smegmatis]
MSFTNIVRQHTAALRALLALTVVLGLGYPVFIWLVAQLPGLQDKADGSIIEVAGKSVGSSLIGQSFTDADGNPLPQYFQPRPSAAGDGYDPMATSASNLGPESVIDQPDKPSLLTQVCQRSRAVGDVDGISGARPFCTPAGVGAVLSVIGPRDSHGNVITPTRVVSVNEPCADTKAPFLYTYEGVRVECAEPGENYAVGQIVPVRGTAAPQVPADAVTASGSGLDPDISPAYADLQVNRIASARGVDPQRVRELVAQHTEGRTLGFLGEPRVNVLELNIALDTLAAHG